jgi:hypothetical protein
MPIDKAEPNAIGYAKFRSRSHDHVIRVYDAAGNVIETRQSEGADKGASSELFSRDFSDENEIHSTPTSSREHANTVGDRFPQRVRSTWFSGLLRWRARTSCHPDSGCDRNACANSHPVSNFCAAQHSAPVKSIGSAHDETLSVTMRVSNPDRSPLRIICKARVAFCGVGALQIIFKFPQFALSHCQIAPVSSFFQ